MRDNFRHLRFNNFPMIYATLWGQDFWPLQLCSENSGILLGLRLPTWEFTCECEGSFPHTLCTPRSMWCDSRASLLAHDLPTPCLVREPKARVATKGSMIFSWGNQRLGKERITVRLYKVYIAKGVFQNQANRVAHYTIKGDGFKFYHHPISCAMELMEMPTKRFCWKMNTRHFEETKEQIQQSWHS